MVHSVQALRGMGWCGRSPQSEITSSNSSMGNGACGYDRRHKVCCSLDRHVILTACGVCATVTEANSTTGMCFSQTVKFAENVLI